MTMHSYPINSAQAAGRILALTIIADGNFAPNELEALHRSGIFQYVELDEPQFRQIVRQLCEDLHASATHGIARLDHGLIDSMLDEIVDSDLRRKLLQVMWRIADADGCLSDSEAVLLSRASATWQAENYFR
jgi:uncharacterized tellurite resistance protein B-like protein